MKLLTRYRLYQARAFALTWISFFLFMTARLPAAITKSALNPPHEVNSSADHSTNQSIDSSYPSTHHSTYQLSATSTFTFSNQYSIDLSVSQWGNQSILYSAVPSSQYHQTVVGSVEQSINGAGWYPFNDPEDGTRNLGYLDTSYLTSYAVSMFFLCSLGDRIPLRIYLGVGMLGTGALLIANGLFYYWHVHKLWAWCLLNCLFGIFQTTAWPGCMSGMCNWFGKKRIGFTIGIWATHAAAGSLCGKYVGAFLQSKFGWQWNFIGIGAAVMVGGVIQMIWLIAAPKDVFTPAELQEIAQEHAAQEDAELLKKEEIRRLKNLNEPFIYNPEDLHSINAHHAEFIPNLADHVHEVIDMDDDVVDDPSDLSIHQPVSYMQALRVPGVLECGIALTFTKLIVYALGLWMPFYLNAALGYSPTQAANLSTACDYGGVLSGILVGLLSDWAQKRASLSFLLSLLSIPIFFLYTTYGGVGVVANAAMLFSIGLIAYGPTVLIAGPITSDLGGHPSLKGNLHARSTIAGVIDGFGSIGACFTGMLVSGLSTRWGWPSTYYTYMILAAITSIVVSRVAWREFFPVKTEKSDITPALLDECDTSVGLVIAPIKMS